MKFTIIQQKRREGYKTYRATQATCQECHHKWAPVPGCGWKCPECQLDAIHATVEAPCKRCGARSYWVREKLEYACLCPCVLPAERRRALAEMKAKRDKQDAAEREKLAARSQKKATASSMATAARECWTGIMQEACTVTIDEPFHDYCSACPKFAEPVAVQLGFNGVPL